MCSAIMSLIFALLTLMGTCIAQQPDFVRLFDGHSIDGWVQRGGHAKYEVIDGMIVGTAVPDSPNSFLCTTRDYTNFILELELKVDEGLNSGIQIRSHYAAQPTMIRLPETDGASATLKIPANRVFGYQVEVDASDRAFSGGIYDEARRGWLYNLEGDQHRAAREAFRRNDWNHYRVEAIGNSLKTWINGVPVADLTDDVDATGFIALQVHSVDHDRPLQVRWRDIWIKELPASP